MTIDSPKKENISDLRALWAEAFGDGEEFLDIFEETAFSPDRCRCVIEYGKAVAALYWFNCSYRGNKIAYLYAIATAESHRGKGICSALMRDTHLHLRSLGYKGAILVPGSNELFEFYKRLGYETCSSVGKLFCAASADNTEIRQINADEYADLRRSFLLENGVIQENENIRFLQRQAAFYAGEDFLLAARGESDTLYGIELLGNSDKAPAIVNRLGYSKGIFRIPANDIPFAMYCPLTNEILPPPAYFGLAFD